jgi:hypothetical protein
MDEGAQWFFTVVLIVPCVGFFAYALWRGLKARDWLVMIFWIGGAMNVPCEAIVDILGGCYFPQDGQWTAITLLDRDLPVFLAVAYPWFIGGQGYIVYRMLERGVPRQTLWRWWISVMVIDLIVVQIPGLGLDMYTYYGPQPGEVFGLPLHWLPVDAAAPMLAGAIVFRLRPYLEGWRQLALLPLIGAVYGLMHTALSWPVWMAFGSGVDRSVSWIATVATFGFATTAVWAIITAGTMSKPGSRPRPLGDTDRRRTDALHDPDPLQPQHVGAVDLGAT